MKKSLKMILVASTIFSMTSCTTKSNKNSVASSSQVVSTASSATSSSNSSESKGNVSSAVGSSNVSISSGSINSISSESSVSSIVSSEINRKEGNIENIPDSYITDVFNDLGVESKEIDEIIDVIKNVVKNAYNDEENLKVGTESIAKLIYQLEMDYDIEEESDFDYFELISTFMGVSDYYSIGICIKNLLEVSKMIDHHYFYDALGIKTNEDLQNVVNNANEIKNTELKNQVDYFAVAKVSELLIIRNAKVFSNVLILSPVLVLIFIMMITC